MRPVGFITDRRFLEHEYPGHPERPERLGAIIESLDAAALLERMQPLAPRPATDEELLRVHEPKLVAAVLSASEAGGGWLDADTYVNAMSDEIALLAAGSVVTAVDAVLSGDVGSAFAAVRPPGHHATPSVPMGFCLFNNVAVAATAALERGIERVAIVDWDVHHGNGTQEIFIDDPRVLYVSSHVSPFYPGTGHFNETGAGDAHGTNVNIPLPPNCGDRAFAETYEQVVVPALRRFQPHLILISSGWDAHVRDPLAPLALSTAGYGHIAGVVLAEAEMLCEGRVVVALEGGYDTHALGHCAANLCRLLLGEAVRPDPEDPPPGTEPGISGLLASVRESVGLS
jgi:acetoin utilization deacetylase AcuC-like enzyme